METPLIEMELTEMIRICESIGIDATMYSELIEEMFWDGFCAAEIKEQIEVLEDKHKYAHLRSI